MDEGLVKEKEKKKLGTESPLRVFHPFGYSTIKPSCAMQSMHSRERQVNP